MFDVFNNFIGWLMLEGSWQHSAWFFYVTFHDLIQWAVMGIIGLTAWGERKHKKALQDLVSELQNELSHVHREVHTHIEEDATLHDDLGQRGKMSRV